MNPDPLQLIRSAFSRPSSLKAATAPGLQKKLTGADVENPTFRGWSRCGEWPRGQAGYGSAASKHSLGRTARSREVFGVALGLWRFAALDLVGPGVQSGDGDEVWRVSLPR